MDSITDAHARLLRDPSIQFHFSTHILAPQPPSPAPRLPLHLGDERWLFWIVLTIVLLASCRFGLQAVRDRRKKRRNTSSPAAPAPMPPVTLPVTALPEADAVAAMGRFGEAAHILLLRGVAAIDARFPRALSPSDTSREIASLDVVPEATRIPFAGLAASVERVLFAGGSMNAAEWQRCRALYAGLTQATPR